MDVELGIKLIGLGFLIGRFVCMVIKGGKDGGSN